MPRFDKLLVLDLDETLVYADVIARGAPGERTVGPYFVVERPGLRPFIERCLEWFAVGIWTASTRDYAGPVVREFVDLERLAFLWDRKRCTWHHDIDTREHGYLKDLRKLRRRGYRKEQILVVDDSPRKLKRSYGNLIRIDAFEGDPADRELDALLVYLEALGPVPNVRRIEKRGWRTRIRPASPEGSHRLE
ncbi:MAG: HAD family hydrolase [Myxococcota bacterium]